MHGPCRRNSGCRKKGCARLPAQRQPSVAVRGFQPFSPVSRCFDFRMTTSRPTSRCGTPLIWWLGRSLIHILIYVFCMEYFQTHWECGITRTPEVFLNPPSSIRNRGCYLTIWDTAHLELAYRCIEMIPILASVSPIFVVAFVFRVCSRG